MNRRQGPVMLDLNQSSVDSVSWLSHVTLERTTTNRRNQYKPLTAVEYQILQLASYTYQVYTGLNLLKSSNMTSADKNLNFNECMVVSHSLILCLKIFV